ncbi:MAG: putative glycoside hydrolase, partial [Clostridia bacterium]|nr:putative glycoside hydrolase [Clostridia bacterium]
MYNQYTCSKLMIRLFVILIILIFNLLRLEPVSLPQPGMPVFSYERLLAFREAMVLAGEEEEKPELSAVPPATRKNSFSTQDYEPVFPPRRVEPVPLPPQVRGVYVTGWTAGSPARFSALLELAEKTCINSLVIDIKDDTGLVSYYSAIPAVRKLGAWAEKIPDPGKMLATLKQRGIYPIARLVLFKDPVLGRKRPDLAIQNIKGGIWVDNKGLAWVDPNSREVWEYNIAIAKEAAAMGFPEIQFDYVRFPSDGRLENCLYSHAGGKTKPEVIEDFLRYAREQLEPLGVLVSVDLFGLVCSDPGHIGIGQNLEGVAGVVEILSPMVYPSHYNPGTYGLANPDRQPYATVYRSLADAQDRLARGDGVLRRARLRPLLQAFSMKARYGREEILAQIKAARAAGVEDWLFWNAGSRYNPAHYPDEEELAALLPIPPVPPQQEEPPTEELPIGEPPTEEPLPEEP